MLDDDIIEGMRANMERVVSVMGNSTIIAEPILESTRNALYCIMKAYGLSFRTCTRAGWSWIEICESENAKALNASEITSRRFDEDEFLDACETIAALQANNGETHTQNGQDKPEFGWLAPDGKFISADFGEHEYSANEIISNMGWTEDFLLGYADKTYSPCAGDYLVNDKNYALIHNPSSPLGKPFVTKSETRPLTKRQKEFLYGYYMELGDELSANMYVDD